LSWHRGAITRSDEKEFLLPSETLDPQLSTLLDVLSRIGPKSNRRTCRSSVKEGVPVKSEEQSYEDGEFDKRVRKKVSRE